MLRRAIPALCLALTLTGCSRVPEAVPPPEPGFEFTWSADLPRGRWNLLLLTLDTTRRDALGCYGRKDAGTPTLDSLAHRGVLFDQAVAAVPITAPSHVTIHTGLDPMEHGVRDNSWFVAPDSLRTLAEMFEAEGYETAAVLSAFPLNASFGLAQGFQTYEGSFVERAREGVASQRRGNETTDIAVGILEGLAGRPFFLWVHYFDPHFPYEPPEPFRSRHPEDLYQGEVSFMDAQIGRLLRAMRSLGLDDFTMVLAVGDHGESLGEHGEPSHTFFVYDATQLVPAILVPPGAWDVDGVRARTFEAQIRLRDLAPTAANGMGWEPDPWRAISSASLFPALTAAGAHIPVAYVETLVPEMSYGWSDLRGVRSNDWKYIRAPRPELYRLRTDPGELRNVAGEHPDVLAGMEAWLDWYLAFESETPLERQHLDAETLERLRSLGYVAGSVEGGTGADPKDRVGVHNAVVQAQSLADQFRFEEAIPLLESVVRTERDNPYLLHLLASSYAKSGRMAEADEIYRSVVAKDAEDVRYLKGAAQVALFRRDYGRASDLAEIWRSVDPDDEEIWLLKGQILERQDRWGDALAVYEEQLEEFPGSYEAHYAIGRAKRQLGDLRAAQVSFGRALESLPTHAPSLSELAELAEQEGDARRAEELRARALGSDPYDPTANYRAGVAATKRGDYVAARSALQRALARSPDFAGAIVALADVDLMTGRQQAALQGYEQALALGYDTAELRVNLGALQAQAGRLDEAISSWERALELGPDESVAAGLRQNLEKARGMIESR